MRIKNATRNRMPAKRLFRARRRRMHSRYPGPPEAGAPLKTPVTSFPRKRESRNARGGPVHCCLPNRAGMAHQVKCCFMFWLPARPHGSALFSSVLCFLLPLLLLPACGAQDMAGPAAAAGKTIIRVRDEVLVESPHRLGINIGASAYYGDQQMVSNPFFHGGFPKGRQVYFLRTAAGSSGDTVIDAAWSAKKHNQITESFAGATYCVATGPRAGETGRVTAHEPGSGEYTLENGGAPFGEGEYLWLTGPFTARALPDRSKGEKGIGIGDFRLAVEEGVKLDYVASEAPAPHETPDQAMRLTFPNVLDKVSGGVKHYIKATPDTAYRVRIRARSEASHAELSMLMQNFGIHHTQPGARVPMRCEGDNRLTSEWREYVFSGHTAHNPDIAKKFSVFRIGVTLSPESGGGAAYIDSIALEDERLASKSGFNRYLAEAITEARCGTIRFYGIASIAALTESITAASTTQSAWTYLSLSDYYRLNETCAVADQWFQLCARAEAEPWITVGGANTPADWYDFISYLAAPAEFDRHSKRRASHGFDAPWTGQFGRIYLEIGNEWWNRIFRPYYMWDPEKYAQLCSIIIARVREHPHFDPEKIKLVVGGWAINAHHWNGRLDAACQGHDRVSIAPYLVHELGRAASDEDKYGALFADVDAYRAHGGASTLEELNANGTGTGLAVYELNTHITGGAAPKEAASEICSSVAAGVAVLDQAMSVMAHLGADPINYFTALKHNYNGRLGLWGTLVRTADGSLRPRPVWHGLRLANQHLIAGSMVAVDVENSPAWNQPANGSVPEMRAVPVIHAYAFIAGETGGKRRCNVLIVNRDRAMRREVRIRLPFAHTGSAARVALTAGQIDANNEDAENVTLEEDTLNGLGAPALVAVPPYSATVLAFRAV